MKPFYYLTLPAITVLFLSGNFISYAQSDLIDSLRTELKNDSRIDTTTIQMISQLAWKTVRDDSTLNFINNGLILAEKINYRGAITSLTCIRGWWHFRHENMENAMSDGLSAFKAYDRNTTKHISGRLSCLSLIASIYLRALDTERALSFYRQMLAEAKKLKSNEYWLATGYEGIALIFEHSNQLDSALVNHKRVLAIRQNSSSTNLVYSYNNVGSSYSALGDQKSAKKYLEEALSLAIKLHDDVIMGVVQQSLGQMYQRVGNYHEARTRFLSSLQYANIVKDLRRKEDVLTSLSNLELIRQNFPEAYKFNQRLLQVKDSLYNSEKFAKAAALEILHATKNKEQTIALLQQERQFESQIRFILVSALILLLFTATTIVLLQRSRSSKTRQLLATQQQLNERLQEMDQVKSKFFAHISHEFRTPLTLVLTPLDQQIAKQVHQEDRTQLTLIKRNAVRLLELVNELLDLAKLEAGKMDLHLRKDSLELLLQTISKSFESVATSRKIKFMQQIGLNGEEVYYDKDKIEKIVTNLLSNAFKFTPSGGSVTISSKFEGPPERQFIKISLQDSGPGITKTDQQYIFLPFYQGASRNESSVSGTGLGLSLVKELVKLYKGDIHLDSIEGKGTTVTITVPCFLDAFSEMNVKVSDDSIENLRQELIAEPPAASNPATRPIVLVVEDNPELKNFIHSILSGRFNVVTATNGEEAIDQIKKSPPDVVVTDFMMPGLNGAELTTTIKTDPLLKHIPVIILTAKNDQFSKSKTLDHGADDYIAKPFSINDLIFRISSKVSSDPIQ